MQTLRAIAPALSLCLAAGSAAALDPARWDALLAEHTVEVADVAGVRVDYAALAQDPRWPELLSGLAGAAPPRGRSAELAFWINAYNVLAIDVVLRNRPVASIRDAGSLLRPVWSRPAGRAAGREVTLGEIEHEILRPLGDARIHAAIVCASTSCPSLARAAFRPEHVDVQLDEAVRRFLADPRKGARVTKAGDALRVSRIFRWFDEDFEAAGGVRAWLAPRLPEAEGSWLRSRESDARLVYFDYDWGLNDVRR